ncbi:MAG: acyltransferase [Clostridia bacterium]|nr:acyltransferase [Clostridia bacterium]
MEEKNIKKTLIIQSLFWVAVEAFLLCVLEFIGLNIVHRSLKTIILLFLIVFGSIVVHLYYGIKKPNYVKKDILALNSNQNRSCKYDYLRVIAASFVIITHVVQSDTSQGYITEQNGLFTYRVIYVLTLSCNLIYVMLSGALLLPYKEESLFDFYTKRVSKVGIPLVIYYIFYLWQSNQLTNITFDNIKDFGLRLLEGRTSDCPHYWLIYTILSIYIVIPFFRYMFKNMSYKLLCALTGIIILFMSLTTFFEIRFAISTFLSSWIGVAIVGYWATREETRKYDGIIIIVGILAIGVAVYLIKTNDRFLNLICNCSPIMTMISVGIFASVFKFKKIFDKGNWIVRILSKYSYAIILVHWWTLYRITIGRYGIRAYMYDGLGVIFSYLITLFISFCIAFLIDNLVIVVFDYIFNLIAKWVKKFFVMVTGKQKQEKATNT